VKTLSDVIRAMFIACHQNKYQISAHWLKIKSHRNSPEYPVHINRSNSSSLLISQQLKHVSPCKPRSRANDWVRKVSRTVIWWRLKLLSSKVAGR